MKTNALRLARLTPLRRSVHHLRHCLLALLCLLGLPAQAACNWDVAFSPPFPTTISSTQTVGNVIYNGTVTYTVSGCVPSSSSVFWQFGWGTSASAIWGMTGLAAESSFFSVVSKTAGTGLASVTSAPTVRNLNWNLVSVPLVGIVMVTDLKITATATTVTGSLPSPMQPMVALVSAGVGGSSTCGWGWVGTSIFGQAITCQSYSISGFTGTSVVANTCTVSTPSTAVQLPNVSRTSLGSAGATAGLTPFTLSFTGCSATAAGFSATQTWSFTPGPSANTISNAGSAANVYAQILDSTMTPIANGSTVTFTVPAGGGALVQNLYARYYASGVAGAGTLSSTATFTMTYQ